jgi:hypothetical protein
VAYSKLASGTFPSYPDIAKAVAAYAASGKAPAEWKAKQ